MGAVIEKMVPTSAVMIAVGAYGREANAADWNKGKDFKVYPSGPYFSNRDLGAILESGKEIIVFLDRFGDDAFTVVLRAG